MSKIKVFDKREKKEKVISQRLFNNHLKHKVIGSGKESIPRYEVISPDAEKKNSPSISKEKKPIKDVKIVDEGKLKDLHEQYEKIFEKKVAPKFSRNVEWIEKKIKEAAPSEDPIPSEDQTVE